MLIWLPLMLLLVSSCNTAEMFDQFNQNIDSQVPSLSTETVTSIPNSQNDLYSSQDTPIVTLEASKTISIKSVTFDFSSANQIAPRDILKEISFGASGGGGFILCDSTINQPNVPHYTRDAQLHEWIYLHTCGWQNNELITYTIVSPDGTVEEYQNFYPAYESESRALTFRFKTDILQDPPGLYKIIISGQSGTVQVNIDIQQPVGAHVYWNDGDTFILYNFAPNETVWFLAYSHSHTDGRFAVSALYAWQSYTVDQNGRLIVYTNFSEDISWYTVVGEITGEKRPESITFYSPESWFEPILENVQIEQ